MRRNFEEFKMCGYTLIINPDGYVRYAYDTSGTRRYPYNVEGNSITNASGMLKVKELRNRLKAKTTIWG